MLVLVPILELPMLSDIDVFFPLVILGLTKE